MCSHSLSAQIALCGAALVVAMTPAACSSKKPAPPPPAQVISDTPSVPEPEVSAPPQADDRGLVDAQRWLAEQLTNSGKLDVTFDGPAVDLTPPVTLDFEHGSGHGGSLVFVRLSVDAATTKCERVSWQAYLRKPTDVAGEAGRADVATSIVSPLFDTVRALSRAHVTQRPRDDGYGSSNDFFALVRVCGTRGASDNVWEFAGYSSSENQVRYAALDAVIDRAMDVSKSIPWAPVPRDAYRTTHFSDAFIRNRGLYAEEFHRWIMERSVEASGWFGDRSTLPTVTWIRDHVPDLRARQVAKVRHILDEPDVYLDGPPRDVPEK